MIKKLTQFFKDEDGATAVEYGLMVALIAAVIIIAVTTVGQTTQQERAGDPPGVYPGRHPSLHQVLHLQEGLPVDDGRAGIFSSYRGKTALAIPPPNEGSGMYFVG